MNTQVQTLQERLVQLSQKAGEIQAKADAECRGLTRVEQSEIDSNLSAFDETKARLATEMMNAEISRPRPRKTGPEAVTTRFGSTGAEFKAFGDFVKSGARIMNATSMTVGGGADDGAGTVPTVVSNQIREVQKDFGAVRQLANVMQTAQPVQVPIATTLPGAQWRVEGNTREGQTVPVVKTATLAGGALSSVITVSNWLVNDSAWNMEQYITGAIARAFGITEAAAFLNGTGADGQVKGILQYDLAATADASRAYGTLEKLHTGSTSGGVTADFLLSLSVKLDPSYRKNAVVILNPATYASLLSEKATGGGGYILTAGSSAGFLPPLWGMPVFLDVNMPVEAENAPAAIVADLRAGYTIQDVGPMSTVRDPYTSKGNILLWCESRLYAGVVDSNAIKVGYCAA